MIPKTIVRLPVATFLCLLYCIGLFPAQHVSFMTIEKQHIQRAKQQASREIYLNQQYRYAFWGATALIAGGCLYTLFSGTGSSLDHNTILETIKQPEHIQLSQEDTIKIIQECKLFLQKNEIVLDNHTQTLIQHSQDIKDLKIYNSSWTNLIKNNGTYLLLSLMITGGLSPLGKYFKKVDSWFDGILHTLFGIKNLEWFLQTHTHLYKMIDLVIKDATDHNQIALPLSWNLLTQELIKILGFITHRSSELSLTFPLESARMYQCAFDIQSQVNQLAQGLNTHPTEHMHALGNFKNCIKSILDDFALIELRHI